MMLTSRQSSQFNPCHSHQVLMTPYTQPDPPPLDFSSRSPRLIDHRSSTLLMAPCSALQIILKSLNDLLLAFHRDQQPKSRLHDLPSTPALLGHRPILNSRLTSHVPSNFSTRVFTDSPLLWLCHHTSAQVSPFRQTKNSLQHNNLKKMEFLGNFCKMADLA
jgi:hypothetical protein